MGKYKTIGILGGMGAEATSDLYLKICKFYQDHLGAKQDRDFPPIMIYSVPIPDVVESLENEELTLEMLQHAAQVLEKGGCDFIVVACNTVQFLLEPLRESVGIPIVGIAESAAEYLREKNLKRVGILSTETTIQKRIYDDVMGDIGVELIKPSVEDQAIITEVIMAQLSGKTTSVETERLVMIAEHLKSFGAEAVLLACTDLPLIIGQKNTRVPLVNCTEIYANEAAGLSAAGDGL